MTYKIPEIKVISKKHDSSWGEKYIEENHLVCYSVEDEIEQCFCFVEERSSHKKKQMGGEEGQSDVESSETVTKRRTLDTYNITQCYVAENGLWYYHDTLYDKCGKVSDEVVRKEIHDSIAIFSEKLHDRRLVQNLGTVTKNILEQVKVCATVTNDEIINDENIIPFANGDLYVAEREFHEGEFAHTLYRLPVAFHPDRTYETPNFDKWCSDLFCDEDLPTVLQYLGYCLVPSTKAQKSLILVGAGGAGKSVIGTILNAILGKARLAISDTREFLSDKYKKAELENVLTLYDDDLDSAALESTGFYKKLITNETPMLVERKFGQPYEITPRVKLVSCCNQFISSLYDNTDGFFRRLLPIKIKPKREDFEPDLKFNDKIRDEAEGILNTAVGALYELIKNNWVLPESERSREYLESNRRESDNKIDFIEQMLIPDTSSNISSTELYNAYREWCNRNGTKAVSSMSFSKWMRDNCESYGMTYAENVKRGDSRVRGYTGTQLKKPESDTYTPEANTYTDANTQVEGKIHSNIHSSTRIAV